MKIDKDITLRRLKINLCYFYHIDKDLYVVYYNDEKMNRLRTSDEYYADDLENSKSCRVCY